jgi:hypothetical protein
MGINIILSIVINILQFEIDCIQYYVSYLCFTFQQSIRGVVFCKTSILILNKPNQRKS